MGGPEVVKVLTDLLHNKDLRIDLRVAAAEGLGFTGFTSGRDALLKVIEDSQEEWRIREAAIRALGQTVHTVR